MSPTVPPISVMIRSGASLGSTPGDPAASARASGDQLIGDVRDDLDRLAEILTTALLVDDPLVDLAGRHIGAAVQVHVQEALVVADVEVGLSAVLGDEDLSVLERVHRAGVDIEVRIELLHRHRQPTRSEAQVSEGAGGEALAAEG